MSSSPPGRGSKSHPPDARRRLSGGGEVSVRGLESNMRTGERGWAGRNTCSYRHGCRWGPEVGLRVSGRSGRRQRGGGDTFGVGLCSTPGSEARPGSHKRGPGQDMRLCTGTTALCVCLGSNLQPAKPPRHVGNVGGQRGVSAAEPLWSGLCLRHGAAGRFRESPLLSLASVSLSGTGPILLLLPKC